MSGDFHVLSCECCKDVVVVRRVGWEDGGEHGVDILAHGRGEDDDVVFAEEVVEEFGEVWAVVRVLAGFPASLALAAEEEGAVEVENYQEFLFGGGRREGLGGLGGEFEVGWGGDWSLKLDFGIFVRPVTLSRRI